MTRTILAPALLFAALGSLTLTACSDKGGGDSGDIGDGGTDGDGGGDTAGGDTGTGPDCEVVVDEFDPEDGDTDVYWQDSLEVTLDGATDDVAFTLTDSSGAEIPLSEEWSEGGLVATLSPGEGMTGLETYTLTVDVCGETFTSSYTTSAYGLPLESDVGSLAGNTYFFDLPGATFVQPPGVGALLGTFLDVPILLGVTEVSSSSIDWLGAQAERNSSDEWVQDTAQLTWDFPAADFSTAPYFEAEAAEIVIGYAYGGDLYEIPVYNFRIEGTISADGATIGGGRAIGQGDTRNMGPLLGAGDKPEAACEFLSSVGLVCEDCGDGTESCITLEALFPEAPLLPDVDLIEVTAD